MTGLFGGFHIAVSGLLAHRARMEVTGNNIANAANEGYTRQDARVATNGALNDGHGFIGQGVHVEEIVRIRDELLDDQLRDSTSSAANQEIQGKWLAKIETIYNEPSDSGINEGLSQYWEAWSELSNDPESFAARANLISRTDQLATMINNVDFKLDQFKEETDQEISQILNSINNLTGEIAQLNKDIFQIEAGETGQANDLRDQRDVALDRLAQKVGISYNTSSNGMLNVYIGDHPAVFEDRAEKLETRMHPLDTSKVQMVWEHGEVLSTVQGGELAGVLKVRDTVIPDFVEDLDQFSQLLIEETNKIYATGVGLQADTKIESNLGYQALGVQSTTESLSILNTGETGAIHISFHDSAGDITRTHAVIVDSDDSLADVQLKLDSISGIDVSLLSSTTNDGRLSFELSAAATETGFTISNNTDGYDTSGVINALGFNATSKSGNNAATSPTLTSLDLTTVANNLGMDPATVQTTALNMAGSFTINGFEQMTQSSDPTKAGYLVEQHTIDVVSTDTITSIRAKIDAISGFSTSVVGNQMIITSSLMTDNEGNISATGTNNLQLSFANTYEGPTVTGDNAPDKHSGTGDDTGLLAKLQFNTLFQGSDAGTIALDEGIIDAEEIHAGFKLASGNNSMALSMTNLQHRAVGSAGQFTINDKYQNLIAQVGTDVEQAGRLARNERLLVDGFESERQRISGVNLDEELANMILYQRTYEANARLLSAFDQLTQELLNL